LYPELSAIFNNIRVLIDNCLFTQSGRYLRGVSNQ